MTYLKQVRILVWKDVVSEMRTKETISSMLIFSLLIPVIFGFAFDPDNQTIQKVFPGVLWVVIAFSGILGLNRAFQSEKTNDCIAGLMLVTVDRGVIYLGKLISNLIFMLIVELITIPVLFILFDYKMQGSPLSLLLVVLLGTWGFIAVGTFLASLAVNTRNSEILLPVILFPLLVPLLIAAVQATGAIINGDSLSAWSNWVGLLVAFDLIFTVVAWLLFDYVLEV